MSSTADAAHEIGFIESYALAENRGAVLKQLIPGTEDHYYFHCLHYQSIGDLAAAEKLLEPWRKRHGENGRFREIRHRQALLAQGDNPKATLDYLIRQLNLRFDHQKEELNKKPALPTALDPKQVAYEAFIRRAYSSHKNLGGIEAAGLDAILREGAKLDTTRRRDLLSRLTLPDFPGLPALIAADLKTKESRGFGEFKIHRALLPDQLDELLKLRPELIKNTKFVHTVVAKLRPGADIDWQNDAEEKTAYLKRVWAYAVDLSPAFNALKAHSLYQLLDDGRNHGRYDKKLFLEYLKLPRRAGYVEPKYLDDPDRRRVIANLETDFGKVTACKTIGNDEPLVRDFFLHLFVKEASWKTYAEYVREDWLKPVFAEAKILAGLGDQEKYYSLLSPSAYEALKERVDLQFAPWNPRQFAAEDEVSLEIGVKNVRDLIVKVYEVNALNYYLQEGREVNTDLQLDGLVANSEQTHTFDLPPLRRELRKFEFPELKGKRGVWVIEFIGNGRSSRALVRKGGLQYIARTTAAGTEFTVLDLENKAVPSPSVWVAARKFEAGDDHKVLVPFSTNAGRQPVVLTDGNFAALEFYDMPGESYALSAGFHVDAETLLPGHTTSVAIRPALTLNGVPTTLGLLEDVALSISSTDRDGITSTLSAPSFELAEDRESTHPFRVPERLSTLYVTLTASVQSVSTGERQQLSATQTFEVNGIDRTQHVWMPHLAKIDGNYVIEVLGKTGEAIADVPLRLKLKHRDFTKAHAVTLKSTADGQIDLGPLVDIDMVMTDGAPSGDRTWRPAQDGVHLPSSLHGLAGSELKLPYAGSAGKVTPADFALLEVSSGGYASNALQAISLGGGYLTLKGLGAGDYELHLKELRHTVSVRVTAGQASDGYALGEHRHLETKRGGQLQIVKIDAGKEKTRIELGGSNPFARLHLIATRYLPQHALRNYIGGFPYAEPYIIGRAASTSRYLSGRDIGDEYRYIIERRSAQKFPGNMLSRPGLILNPWAIRDTDTNIDDAKEGEEWDATAEDRKSEPKPGVTAANQMFGLAGAKENGGRSGSPNLDFLAEGATVLYNLVPDENGVVTIDTADLGDRQFLHVLAVDPQNSVYRQISLPERGTKVRDLRLTTPLDPDGHFSEQKQTTVLAKGETLEISDVRTAKVETYEDLSKVYTYLSAMGGDDTLAEFRFLVDWPTLKPEEKRAKLSKYACHELHFFLSHRDPEFFDAVVKPYLANKRDKTFMDDYLLGADLNKYLEPWRHGRLNAVEQILLAGSIAGTEPTATARHLGDVLDLKPRDITRENIVFDTAVKGLGLDSGVTTVTASLGEIRNKLAFSDFDTDGFAPGRSLDRGRGVADPAAPAAAAAPPAPKKSRRLKEKYKDASRLSESLEEAEVEMESLELMRKDEEMQKAVPRFAYFGKRSEVLARKQSVRLFRQLEKTKEFAENNYYHRRITDQGASLVTPNAFWKDFASHIATTADQPFLSAKFGEASRNFTEAVFALAVLDLPFAADRPEAVAGATQTENPLGVLITANSPTIVFHREIKAAPISDERSPLLVAQNYFRLSDRYETRAGERYDKFVRDEFLTGVVYGSQIAVTNPTSARQKLDLLVQIPAGALPVSNSKYTRGQHLSIEPYATQTAELHFYFPHPSEEAKPFRIFPAHAAKNEAIAAWAEGLDFTVVQQATKLDTGSWDYVSQHAEAKVVLDYLGQNNPRAVDLGRIAWRMRDRGFFDAAIDLLAKRHVYHGTLYSYALHHGAVPAARDFLAHQEGFLDQCGLHLESTLVTIDPVERHRYEHLEYAPLVNARAHSLGKDRKILNSAFRGQYQRFLTTLSYKANLDAEDRLALSYYLFLQDRIGEALTWFATVDPSAVAEKIQHEYLSCYAAFYQGEIAAAKAIAANYAQHPVKRWRDRFVDVIAHADEISGNAVAGDLKAGDDAENQREKEHEAIAAAEPAIDLAVEGGNVEVNYRNVTDAVVNYYSMDLEFLFSTKPFLAGGSDRFSIIKPNHSASLKLPKNKDSHRFALPEQFAGQNVLVEIVADGKRAAKPYYANTLDVTLVENYGRLEVRDAKSGQPIPRAYVKVYAQNGAGQPVFYKDGYTDLRGKFDYTSLSTDALDGASRFALLVMSEEHGALVKEAAPPVR